MKKISIQREKGYYGMARALKIIVDGKHIGKINQGQAMVFDLPENHQEIWGQMDWGKTRRLDISHYNLNMTIVFKAYFTFNPLKSLGLAKLPFKVFYREATQEELNND